MSNTVLVTGFGPFGKHEVNASWEAVKLLPNYKVDGVDIEVCEIPVLYSYIEEHIPLLWDTYKPRLVVHVGVSEYTNIIKIENQAFRVGYKRGDCHGNVHPTGIVCEPDKGQDCLKTLLNIEQICTELNADNTIQYSTSLDAGRYLCEFIYYNSLNIDNARTLFVHVPVLGQPYTAQELAEALINIIKGSLKQLNHQCECTI